MSPSEQLDPHLAPEREEWVLVISRRLPHSPDQVWAALTEADQLSAWGPFLTDRGLGSPGRVRLTRRDVGDPTTIEGYVHTADRPRLLVYDWEGGTLRWELTDDGDGTRLTLRHRFADQARAPSFAAGWHLCLDSLVGLLAGQPTPSFVGDSACAHGWSELYDHYTQHLMTRRGDL